MSEIEAAYGKGGIDAEPAVAKPPTARDIIAHLVETMAQHGVIVTSRSRGMLAKQAKELLQDGFQPEVILTACVQAVRRGAPGHMHYIAQDIVVHQAGLRLTRREYERELNAATRLLDPAEREHRERLQRILGGET